MNRAAAWVRKYGPRRLIRTQPVEALRVASRMSFRSFGATPALFTSRSSLPNRSRTALDSRRSAASSSPMSAWM